MLVGVQVYANVPLVPSDVTVAKCTKLPLGSTASIDTGTPVTVAGIWLCICK